MHYQVERDLIDPFVHLSRISVTFNTALEIRWIFRLFDTLLLILNPMEKNSTTFILMEGEILTIKNLKDHPNQTIMIKEYLGILF